MSDRIFADDYKPKEKTPSQILMDVLEHFGSVSEGKYIIVVWTDDQENINTLCNSSLSHGIGMLEVAKDIGIQRSRSMSYDDEN